jgi:hypothetical protein
MTTIAIDSKGFVAADGLRTWSGDITGRAEEKLRIRYGRIYALAGTCGAFEPLIKWHGEQEADPDKVPKLGGDNGWLLVVIDGSGLVLKYTNTCPYAEDLPTPVAFGAGMDLAKGAMLAGASAERAVQLVADNTNHTGGRIQVVNIAEALGLQRLEAVA